MAEGPSIDRNTILKFLQVLLIVLIAVGLDQWSKDIASSRLASQRPGHFEQTMVLTVPPEFADKTVEEYLTVELSRNTPEEVNRIASRYVKTEGGVRARASDKLTAGQTLEVTRRDVTIVPDYWDFQYTRNRGAAFSFLADTDSPLRKPFFIVVSLIAVGVILWILAGVALRQQILIWGLSFVCGGAIGNLIDRVRLGYVVDFILWKYTDAYRWPTFNIADAFICVGVAFMVIEMIRDSLAERRERIEMAASGGPPSDAEAEPEQPQA